MNHRVVIWIIDDLKNDAQEAWDVVEKLLHGSKQESASVAPVILWGDGFSWPPFASFRACVDPNAPKIKPKKQNGDSPEPDPSHYPDIVILDLLRQGRKGDKLEGDSFYFGLRGWEKFKPGRHSFVIFWSPYQGQQDAQDFIARIEKNDYRLIPLPTKSASELETTLEPLMKRIVEEEDEQ